MVTVVIPAYNYARYISTSIGSVLGQSYRNIELIVVDDGSTDDTRRVVEAFGDRLRYHYQTNQGLSAARNTGIELASGKYLQFLDADDLLGEHSIESRVRRLEESPEAAFVCCPCRLTYDERGAIYSAVNNLLRGWRLPDQAETAVALSYGNIAPPHAFLVRAAALEQPRIRFDTSMQACEDYDFWFRLMCHHGEPLVETRSKVYYRKHRASMSADNRNQVKHDFVMVTRVYRAFAEDVLPPGRHRGEYAFAIAAAAVKVLSRLNPVEQQQETDQLRGTINALLQWLDENDRAYQAEPSFYSAEFRVLGMHCASAPSDIDYTRIARLRRYTARPGCLMSLPYLGDRLLARRPPRHFFNILYQDLRYLKLRLSGPYGRAR